MKGERGWCLATSLVPGQVGSGASSSERLGDGVAQAPTQPRGRLLPCALSSCTRPWGSPVLPEAEQWGFCTSTLLYLPVSGRGRRPGNPEKKAT